MLAQRDLTEMIERARIQAKQSCSATQAPVIEAVRVPPSAWITSQSTTICRSPSAGRFDDGAQRAADQALDLLRAAGGLAGRRPRGGCASWVARGSIAYSAVTQPLPEPRSHGGALSSSEAVQSTCVSPKVTRHEPSA